MTLSFKIWFCFGAVKMFCVLPQTKVSANLPFVELRAPHRGIFPFTRKDTKGVSKGTPLRYPWGRCPRSNRKRSRSPYAYHESLVYQRGSVTKWLWGILPPEKISKRTPPLGYAFADFSRKRKVSASVGGMSPHQQSISFDERLGWGRNQKVLYFTLSRCFSKPLLHGAVHPTKTQTII